MSDIDVLAVVSTPQTSRNSCGGVIPCAHTVLRVVRSRTTGAYICTRVVMTFSSKKPNERHRVIVPDLAGVRAFFGRSQLAQRLYQLAGFEFQEGGVNERAG